MSQGCGFELWAPVLPNCGGGQGQEEGALRQRPRGFVFQDSDLAVADRGPDREVRGLWLLPVLRARRHRRIGRHSHADVHIQTHPERRTHPWAGAAAVPRTKARAGPAGSLSSPTAPCPPSRSPCSREATVRLLLQTLSSGQGGVREPALQGDTELQPHGMGEG